MCCSSPMKHLFTVGRFKFYYANRSRFKYPGIHLWTGIKHIRILPLPKKLYGV
jgi:hypothetical protein